MERYQPIKESVNDKYILKAVILAGGPGSGKSFILDLVLGIADANYKKEVMSPLGVKIINSDFFFEKLLKDNDIPMDLSKGNPYEEIQQKYRGIAKGISVSRQGLLINSMLPVVLDCTGKDFNKVKGQKEALENCGYDVSMIFVNTSLEVAIERNINRERKVERKNAIAMWRQVQENIGKFQHLFGSKDFFIIDNGTMIPPGSIEAKKFSNGLWKIGNLIFKRPLKNEDGKMFIEYLRKTGGKYLNDVGLRYEGK